MGYVRVTKGLMHGSLLVNGFHFCVYPFEIILYCEKHEKGKRTVMRTIIRTSCGSLQAWGS